MGSILGKYRLQLHPESEHPEFSLGCKVSRFGSDVLRFEYFVSGPVETVRLPDPVIPTRVEGLWTTTCFEAFLARSDGAYLEHNFSPSRSWANYRFEHYRDGMSPALDLPVPELFLEVSSHRIRLIVFMVLTEEFASPASIALSAVIERLDGTKSYWALGHPPGQPDFHHPACFDPPLPAPEQT